MTTYTRAKEQYEQTHKAGPTMRTNYRCAAKGCPNAGCIDDNGEDHPGKCFFHWRAEPHQWPEVTARINANFDKMRNWR